MVGFATGGSCAQIGKNVHLSGGVGIGGVLEPLQAGPVIIEDDCFIGARSEVVEGVIVEQGAVLAMGVFLSSTTKIVDRATGEVFVGRVPSYSVVVPGARLPSRPGAGAAMVAAVPRADSGRRILTWPRSGAVRPFMSGCPLTVTWTAARATLAIGVIPTLGR